jgi:curved DNA-binding protein
MSDGELFVDYYDILQVDPNCTARALETAYRYLAKMYHPDHPETADRARFDEVVEAFRAIRSPASRAGYDVVYTAATGFDFSSDDADLVEERAAISDADVHAKILQALYKRRREHAEDAGVGRYAVQELLQCSDEHIEFHLWYLKAKGFLAITEQGTMAITIEGVDHVIAMSRTTIREKLLIGQSGEGEDQAES